MKKGRPERGPEVETTGNGPAVLWSDPGDISARDLFYGPGGREHQPAGRVEFVEEDLDGSSPKFVVRDENGVKWKVKLGLEARPETAASRLVWAAGYFANEDYFVARLQVEGLPRHLHRGQNFVSPGGVIRDARLKRYLKGEEKIGTWEWNDDPFSGTREWNGLRLLMGLINNWDLKDENNAIYQEETPDGESRRIYMVSDLGASFGTPNLTWPLKKTRGNLAHYRHSKFLAAIRDDAVDVRSPARPPWLFWFDHSEYRLRLRLTLLGRNIPLADARWLGHLLAQLSPAQIRDAFRAAGYSPDEVEGFAEVVEERIGTLREL
ncbi:MAG TPA: hypothetical protein VKV74_18265 [Bryobacteraceae bacterium]|nr:hypothetical protein [Bryobacteraceae bacterium]